MKKQSGFTMIELIIVIVILGILAATALPKFTNLGGDSKASLVKTLAGSMRSANSNILAKAAINNQMGATGTVSTGSANISTVYGYAKDAYELAKAMDLSSDFAGPTRALASGDMQITHSGAPTRTHCGVTYTAATLTATPAYSITTSGCDQQSSRDNENSDKDKDKDADKDKDNDS